MLLTRVIPCLLLKESGFVKTTKFKNPVYLGDPLNIVKIFNEKEVDEVVVLDIMRSRNNQEPNFGLIEQIASECFMPVCYGGGIKNIGQIQQLFALGVEKVAINSATIDHNLIKQATGKFGSQSIVASIDVKKSLFGAYHVHTVSGSHDTKIDPVTYAEEMQRLGVGEIMLTSIDREGTMTGYDIDLIRSVTHAISIPVIANGGARSIDDFVQAVKVGGASAVAASSIFVYHGPQKAVLITYPPINSLEHALANY